jgi:hypothetical protein
MADPEEYRTKEQVAEWRKRDPIITFAEHLQLDEDETKRLDEAAIERVDQAVAFADKAKFPPPESLYDHIYVFGDQVQGWYSVDERSAGVHRGEHERSLAEGERGPDDAYHEAVEAAGKEDVKPADEAQEEEGS